MTTPLRSRSILSWCLYDFANSSYSAVIVAVVFPVYYTSFIVGNETGLGDLWWGRAISLSMAIVALSSPFLGGIADNSGARKRFLVFYTLVSVVCIATLPVLRPGMVIPGFLLIVLANIGMEGGLVFYNAYLPGLAPPGYTGRVSAWGFGLGYAGSMLALVAAIPLVRLEQFGAVWLMVAGFFLVFSLPLFLSGDHGGNGSRRWHQGGLLESARGGFADTVREFRVVAKNRTLRRFLLAFFIYQDGVGTVIVFSSVFAATTLGFATTELIILYIVVQVTALVGSLAMARAIDSWGAKQVIGLSLILWTSVTVIAYFIHTKTAFWGVAMIAGLGLGTVQAASRALYAGLIPAGREAG